MYVFTPQPTLKYIQYKGVTLCPKIGGVSKGNRLVSNQQRMQSIEGLFMDISFKANRSESQRNNRRLKR